MKPSVQSDKTNGRPHGHREELYKQNEKNAIVTSAHTSVAFLVQLAQGNVLLTKTAFC